MLDITIALFLLIVVGVLNLMVHVLIFLIFLLVWFNLIYGDIYVNVLYHYVLLYIVCTIPYIMYYTIAGGAWSGFWVFTENSLI